VGSFQQRHQAGFSSSGTQTSTLLVKEKAPEAGLAGDRFQDPRTALIKRVLDFTSRSRARNCAKSGNSSDTVRDGESKVGSTGKPREYASVNLIRLSSAVADQAQVARLATITRVPTRPATDSASGMATTSMAIRQGGVPGSGSHRFWVDRTLPR